MLWKTEDEKENIQNILLKVKENIKETTQWKYH